MIKKLAKTVTTIAVVAEMTNKEEAEAECKGIDIDTLEEVLRA